METESRRRTSTRYTVSRGVTTRCMYKFELRMGLTCQAALHSRISQHSAGLTNNLLIF